MFRLARRLRRLLADRRGVMLVEYSALTLLIALAAIAVVSEFGSRPG
jgi:Flp pilus assembly pilin Flp